MSFDWQTEDLDWDSKPRETASADYRRPNGASPVDEPVTIDEQPHPRRSRRRSALYAAGVAGLLLALAAVVYWQLQRRVAETERRLTAEVNASHDIIMRATAEEDAELLLSFLSGRDQAWARAQEELVRDGGFVDRAAFGLAWADGPAAPSAASPITPTVTLAPDLRSAELTVPRDYVLDIGRGLTETVTLEQTLVFRPGADRWLLSPPEPEFWGETEMVVWRHIEMIYPARDAATAERLARDLNATLADLCAELEDDCDRLTVRLSTQPGDLSAYDDPRHYWQGGLEMVLPAPTLFGAPVDEAGYRALYRAYAARVASAAVANYAGWACCSDALFYTVLLEAQLHQLGLRPWPVTAEAFAELVAEPSNMAAAEAGWRYNLPASVADGAPAVYALVDFLVEEAGAMPIPEMQRALLDYSNRHYWDWLSRVTGGAYATQADFEREWLRYVVARHAAAREASAPPWPEAALQLLCQEPGALRAALYRYNLSAGRLRRERQLDLVEDPILIPLPGHDGVVVTSRNVEGRSQLPFIWRDGQATTITYSALPHLPLTAMPAAPGSDQMQLFLDAAVTTPLYALASLPACAGRETCAANGLLGAMTPSPDGRRSLLALAQPTPLSTDQMRPLLYLADGQGEDAELVEFGWSPFWLDEDTFGYLRQLNDENSPAVVLRDVRDATLSEARVVLASSDLRRLDGASFLRSSHIERTLPGPSGEELIIFTASVRRSGTWGLVAVYNLSTRELSTRFSLSTLGGYPFDYRQGYGISPDGRWLAVSTLEASADREGEAVWDVYLHTIDGAAPHTMVIHVPATGDDWPAHWRLDWSPDGRWLALAGGGYVRLVAPDDGYSWPLVLPDLACTAAAWVS